MFLGRIRLLLGSEHIEGLDYTETGIAGFDYVIDVTVFRCLVGIGEKVAVLVFFHLDELGGILAFFASLA